MDGTPQPEQPQQPQPAPQPLPQQEALQTLQPNSYTKYTVIVVVVVLLGFVGAGGYFFWTTQDSMHMRQISIDTLNADPIYRYDEILRTDKNIFLCRERRGTESNCVLVLTHDGQKIEELGISVDSRSAIVSSPDKKYLLITQAQKASLLNTFSLEDHVIITVPDDQKLGTYTELPSFVSASEWVDATHIRFSIYEVPEEGETLFFQDANGNLVQRVDKPIEVKVIDISAATTSQLPEGGIGAITIDWLVQNGYIDESEVFGQYLNEAEDIGNGYILLHISVNPAGHTHHFVVHEKAGSINAVEYPENWVVSARRGGKRIVALPTAELAQGYPRVTYYNLYTQTKQVMYEEKRKGYTLAKLCEVSCSDDITFVDDNTVRFNVYIDGNATYGNEGLLVEQKELNLLTGTIKTL